MTSIGEDDLDGEAVADDEPFSWTRVGSEDNKFVQGSATEDLVRNNETYDESDPEDGDERDDSDARENRFVGPSSTWRFFTEEERALAASLDQQRANDLSIHLHIAYALKARAREGEPVFRAKSKGKKKRKTSDDEATIPVWEPEASWTAWPMEPDQVPRKDERFGVAASSFDADETTYRKSEVRSAKSDLEEEIQALMLQKATERARREGVGIDEIEVLVDDEEAEIALRPAVKDIMSKLDDLLIELHERRQRRSRSKSKSRLQPRKGHSHSRPNEITSPDATAQDDLEESTDTQPDQESKQHSKQLTRVRPKRKPDDWTAIIRAARIADFDDAAADRAAERCAALFGAEVESKRAYICPVGDCRRGDTPYDKAWRWREHLKRSHKYSVEDVARAEAALRGHENARRSSDGDMETDDESELE